MQEPKQPLSEGRANDLLLHHRFAYYCQAKPRITDQQYDALEAQVRSLYPVSIADTPGSSNPQDYPVYIREGRRPDAEERRARDERIAARWLDAL